MAQTSFLVDRMHYPAFDTGAAPSCLEANKGGNNSGGGFSVWFRNSLVAKKQGETIS